MLLMSLACDAIALGSNQVEVEVPPFFYVHRQFAQIYNEKGILGAF
jgi:hypothetical protein